MKPTFADEVRLRARESRGRIETKLLNRAVRHHKGPLDEAITWLVDRVVPDVASEPPEDRRGGSDRPPKRRDEAAADEIVCDG